MDSSKWKDDFQKGKKDRELVTKNMNEFLIEHDLMIMPLHKYIKTMRPVEKFHNNTSKNRLEEVGFVKAMGLDHVICDLNDGVTQPVMIRFSNDFGVYIKLPTDFIDKPKQFLNIIEDYWFIFVLRRDGIVKDAYASIITVKEIVSKYGIDWGVYDSKGNKNRLFIHMNPSLFDYRPPHEEDIFGDSFVKQLLRRLSR